MEGPDGRPLLLLSRVGEGRAALLATDHAWLWDRGFEGGGPQLELLRRLAHWLMQEPELEEEALWAEPAGQTHADHPPDAGRGGARGDGHRSRRHRDVGDAGARSRRGGSRRTGRRPRWASTGSPTARRDGDRARPRRAARVRGDHRHGRPAGPGRWRPRTAASCGSRTGCPPCARCARDVRRRGAAGSASPRARRS